MKIAVAGFQHETNRFSPYSTTLFDFEREDGWPGLTSGQAIFDVFPSMNIPLGGFLNFAKGRYDVVPILWTSAEPGGLVEDAAFDDISERILNEIQAALPLDGIYLDLHGAMVTQSHEDGEGELLARLRARFGEAIPIAVSLDLHTNVTMQMTSKADVITIFRTYPHLDMAKTGFRAGVLLDQILASRRRPHCVFRKLPLLIPLQSQCTDLEPTRSIYQHLTDAQSLNTVHADVAMGFPPSDIAENGPAIVVYSYSESVALEKADQIEREFLQSENRFPYPLYREDEGVRLAKEYTLVADVRFCSQIFRTTPVLVRPQTQPDFCTHWLSMVLRTARLQQYMIQAPWNWPTQPALVESSVVVWAASIKVMDFHRLTRESSK